MAHPGYLWIDETTAVLCIRHCYWNVGLGAAFFAALAGARQARKAADKMMFGRRLSEHSVFRAVKALGRIGLPDGFCDHFVSPATRWWLGLQAVARCFERETMALASSA